MTLWFARNPPMFGDVYEYAQVAANLVEHGEAREDFVRYPSWKDVPIPHPAERRFNALTLLYAASYAVAGRSFWTVCLPFLFFYALLPFVLFSYVRVDHDESIALTAALLVQLHPRVLLSFSADPMGDLVILMLLVASLHLYRLGNALLCGTCLAIAFSARETSILLVPAMAVSAFLKSKPVNWRAVATGAAAFLVVFSPFLVRNILVSGGPFVTSEFSPAAAFRDPNLPVRSVFYSDFHYPAPGEADAAPITPARAVRIIGANASRLILGYDIEYSNVAGVPEMVTLPLLIFGVLFWIRAGRRRLDDPALWAVAFFLAVHAVLIVRFEERYLLFPVFLMVMFGLAGLKGLRGRREVYRAVIAAIIAMEIVPTVFLMLLQSVANDRRPMYADMRAVIQEAAAALPPDATWATIPPYAFGFYAGRYNIPFPLDRWSDAKIFLKDRQITGLFISDMTGARPLPAVEGLTPIALGHGHYAYRVSDTAASTAFDNVQLLALYTGIGSEKRPSPSAGFRLIARFGFAGLGLYALVIAVFVKISTPIRNRWIRAVLTIMLAMVSVVWIAAT